VANDPMRLLRDTFYVSVGFGVLAFQKAQVQRREIERAVRPSVEAILQQLRQADRQHVSQADRPADT
jgi:hypothetical protein